MRWGRLGGNNVCTEGLHRGDINFPPEVDVTSKKLMSRQKKVVKKVANNPHPDGTARRGVIHYLFLNYLFLLDRRIPFYDKEKKGSKRVARIC